MYKSRSLTYIIIISLIACAHGQSGRGYSIVPTYA